MNLVSHTFSCVESISRVLKSSSKHLVCCVIHTIVLTKFHHGAFNPNKEADFETFPCYLLPWFYCWGYFMVLYDIIWCRLWTHRSTQQALQLLISLFAHSLLRVNWGDASPVSLQSVFGEKKADCPDNLQSERVFPVMQGCTDAFTSQLLCWLLEIIGKLHIEVCQYVISPWQSSFLEACERSTALPSSSGVSIWLVSWECRTAQTEAERQQEDLPTACWALAAVDVTCYDSVRFKPLNNNRQVFYMTYKEGTHCPKTVRTLCSLSELRLRWRCGGLLDLLSAGSVRGLRERRIR